MADSANQVAAMHESVKQVVQKEQLLMKVAVQIQQLGLTPDPVARKQLAEELKLRCEQVAREVLQHTAVRAAACCLLVEHCGDSEYRSSLIEAAAFITHSFVMTSEDMIVDVDGRPTTAPVILETVDALLDELKTMGL